MQIDKNFQWMMEALRAELSPPVSIQVTTTFDDGRSTTVTTSVGRHIDINGERPNLMYNFPADYVQNSENETDPDPEDVLRDLFGDDYGDGSIIPLDKDKVSQERYGVLLAALKAANRVFRKSYEGHKNVWIKRP